jgi:alkylation response protein AidB-like acyl-CoA dehydrogenase
MAIANATALERAELLELARDFARRELAPRAVAFDAGDVDAIGGCWRQLAELGLDRALLAEEHGGAELEVADFLAVIDELAAGDGGIALCVLLSNAALAAVGAETLMSVPGGARWVLVPGVREVEADGVGSPLDGHLTGVLGAYGADGVVLLGDAPAAIPAGASGLTCVRDETQMGLCGAPMAELTIDGVAARSTRPASGHPVVRESLTLVRAGTAAIARGIARSACKMALQYARERHQGGGPIIRYDAVSDMLAAMAVRVTPPLPAAATDERQALAAKVALTEAAVATATDAVQVFGGTGYMRDTGIEKLMRDAMCCALFPEPNWVARDQLMQDERRPTLTSR